MYYLFRAILSLFVVVIFCNDGKGPLFIPISPSSDFFQGLSIQIDIQAIDQDGIEDRVRGRQSQDQTLGSARPSGPCWLQTS